MDFPPSQAIPPFREILDFIDGLRARGVTRFSGYGINLELGWMPDEKQTLPVNEPKPPVDLGGGLLVPGSLAEDLFGHEK